jgi:ParB family chromosome partitioning protein
MDEDTNSPDTKPARRRGLGRGLEALFENDEPELGASEAQAAEAGGQNRKVVGIEQLEANQAQPRQHFDQEALEELAQSISRHGLLQPLIVRPKEGFPNAYQIIAGERRWRASQIAGLHEVSVIVTEFDDERVLEIALVENLQREDLNPLEEAQGYRRLVDRFGHTQDAVAKAVGKSRSHIANIMRLLNLPETVQKMVADGRLSSGHARTLVTALDPEGLAKKIVAEGLNVRQAEALASEAAGRAAAPPPAKKSSKGQTKDADTRALEEEVSGALGMTVSIDMKGVSAGVLSVNFDNLDQLDDVLHRLSHYPGSHVEG